MTNKIFIITGEHSGDLHASNVVKEVKKVLPDIEIAAVGGENLKNQGVKLFHDHSNMSVGGLGFIRKIPAHVQLGKDIISFLNNEFHPDVVLLVDYGGFNLSIAKHLKKFDYKVFYYISPQVWATRKGRLKKIKKFVDKMMLILPFEEEIHKKAGVNAEYVGHPLINQMPEPTSKHDFCKNYNLDPDKPLIGIFPGSRKMEIQYLLDIFIKSAILIKNSRNDAQFCIAQAGNLKDDLFYKYFNKSVKNSDLNISVIKGANYEILSASDALILTSGTVTLEAGIYKTPMIISYKALWLAYWIFLMIKYIDHVGLPNLILNKYVVPEFLQEKAKPELISEYILKLLDDTPERNEMLYNLNSLNSILTNKVAPKRVAEIITNELQETK